MKNKMLLIASMMLSCSAQAMSTDAYRETLGKEVGTVEFCGMVAPKSEFGAKQSNQVIREAKAEMRSLGLDYKEVLRKPEFNNTVASQLTFLKDELRKTKALSDELVPIMLVNYCGAPNNA